MFTEYRFRREDGNEFLIQDHSAGHPQFGGEATKPHFNVRPADKPRNGKVPGTKSHYPFND